MKTTEITIYFHDRDGEQAGGAIGAIGNLLAGIKLIANDCNLVAVGELTLSTREGLVVARLDVTPFASDRSLASNGRSHDA